MQMDPYIGFLFGLGAMVLLASWAPLGLKRLPFPMTLPIVCVALGFFLFASNVFTADPSPRTWDTLTERMTELVVIGAMSHMCIEATSRAAADFGYPVTVAHDACATMNLEFGGTAVTAAQVHAASMAALGFGYASVTTTDQLLA